MYKTEFGSFNGTNWETFCKQALKIRYTGKYQDMPATFGGDLGIEGFVRESSQVFQCYCPEENCETKKLYEEQRDKMTTDIKKLILNISKLGDHIGKEIKIKEWVFIVPEYNNKDLHQHARTKEAQVKDKLKGLIDESFCITIWNIGELRREFSILKTLSQEYDASVINTESQEDITDWQSQNIGLTDNASRKNKKLIETSGKDSNQDSINKLTHITVTDFLDYQLMLDKWKKDLATEFEKYTEIKNKYESRLPTELILKSDLSSIETIKQIKSELYESYSKSFNGLSHRMITNLVNGTIAEWILQCPIDF